MHILHTPSFPCQCCPLVSPFEYMLWDRQITDWCFMLTVMDAVNVIIVLDTFDEVYTTITTTTADEVLLKSSFWQWLVDCCIEKKYWTYFHIFHTKNLHCEKHLLFLWTNLLHHFTRISRYTSFLFSLCYSFQSSLSHVLKIKQKSNDYNVRLPIKILIMRDSWLFHEIWSNYITIS